MTEEQRIEEYLYDSASFWHPKFGPWSCDNLIRRFQHNGFPGITRQQIIDAHDRMVARGSLLDKGNFA